MGNYAGYKQQLLGDPAVRAAYDELQPEYDIIQALIDARKSKNMTQKDLSEAPGITRNHPESPRQILAELRMEPVIQV